jgi:hypothetical protein
MKDGYRKTIFFHASIKERAMKSNLKLKQPDGTYISDPGIIGPERSQFFFYLLLIMSTVILVALF